MVQSGNCDETYFLVEPVDSSLQETDFKVKNTFDKKYYFGFKFEFAETQNYSSSLMTLKLDFAETGHF